MRSRHLSIIGKFMLCYLSSFVFVLNLMYSTVLVLASLFSVFISVRFVIFCINPAQQLIWEYNVRNAVNAGHLIPL